MARRTGVSTLSSFLTHRHAFQGPPHCSCCTAPRIHSRSSSASKLAPNLQFTQKDAPPPRQGAKKNGHDSRPSIAAQPMNRANSGQRTHSQTHLAPRRPQAPPKNGSSHGKPKSKAGFTIASPGDDEEDVDDDEWVSSESGAATPNVTEPEEEEDITTPVEVAAAVPLQRVPTARPSDYVAPTLPPIVTDHTRHPQPLTPTPSPIATANGIRLPARLQPTRLPASFGLAPKPSPLAPLTVISDADPGAASNPTPQHTVGSPSSLASTISPSSPPVPHRRPSTSSTRTLPPLHAAPAAPRTRTLSSMSLNSPSPSSAALSSLAHRPTTLGPGTRPPSPARPTVMFFPPVNPHAHPRLEDIHPMLPPPYLRSHLTVLARRTPIREAFERVVRARAQAQLQVR
ncbi:hypothetical protein BD779DRAFT_1797832 [Infundibulicybe gibba]|nr:hypothetical protein BD779DRAFT_1797832 [Infundibulicybe gibba]